MYLLVHPSIHWPINQFESFRSQDSQAVPRKRWEWVKQWPYPRLRKLKPRTWNKDTLFNIKVGWLLKLFMFFFLMWFFYKVYIQKKIAMFCSWKMVRSTIKWSINLIAKMVKAALPLCLASYYTCLSSVEPTILGKTWALPQPQYPPNCFIMPRIMLHLTLNIQQVTVKNG